MKHSELYITDLAAYNAGIKRYLTLEIDGSEDEEEILEKINAFLKESPIAGAEEWEITGASGLLDDLYANKEVPSLSTCIEDAGVLSQIDESMVDVAIKLVNEMFLNNILEAKELIEDRNFGRHDCDEDFARAYLEQTGDFYGIPEDLKPYFDYKAYAKDLMHNFFEIDGHYFWDF